MSLAERCAPDCGESQRQGHGQGQWRIWTLENNHLQESIWVIVPHKRTGRTWLSKDDIIEEALCFGWSDSRPRSLDDRCSMLRISPQNPGSAWSAVIKRRDEQMIEASLMMPLGLAVTHAIKRKGRRDKLNAVEALHLPPDLVATPRQYGGAMALRPTPVRANSSVGRSARLPAEPLAPSLHRRLRVSSTATVEAAPRPPERPPDQNRCAEPDATP